MQPILEDLMGETDDKTRHTIHSTVTPELEAKLKKLAKEAKGVEGLHIRGTSSAIARVIETADMLGWLDSVDAMQRIYLAAVTKSAGRKKG
jgi:hypothetical protein